MGHAVGCDFWQQNRLMRKFQGQIEPLIKSIAFAKFSLIRKADNFLEACKIPKAGKVTATIEENLAASVANLRDKKWGFVHPGITFAVIPREFDNKTIILVLPLERKAIDAIGSESGAGWTISQKMAIEKNLIIANAGKIKDRSIVSRKILDEEKGNIHGFGKRRRVDLLGFFKKRFHSC